MTHELLRKYPLISDQVNKDEISLILAELERALLQAVDGDVVELGCYSGTTSLFIARILRAQKSQKQFYVYDSFEGLPEKSSQDQSPAGTQFVKGELFASKRQFEINFKKAGLPLPHIKKSWFNNLVSTDLPDTICLAFLDGDYYDSIHESLKLVWPKLSKNSVVIVDDYQSETLPGAKKAVDEWRFAHPCSIRVAQSLAILKPY